MAHQITPYLPEYDAEPTLDPNSDAEREVGKVLDAPASEQIRFLLDKVVENDQWEQRSNDVDGDHGIALFARQKRQSLARILQAFFMLTFVYVVQLVVIYNLGRFSLQISSDRMLSWVERKQWSNYKVSHNTSFSTNDLSTIITTTFGRYTISFLDLAGLGYCVTRQGVFEAAFNVGAGLFLIYLFIFSDVFFVIMNMPLTRNFPLKEPHGGIMIFGIFIVLCLNSAVLTWLGVVAGQIVISNCGSFFDVLNTSLSVFIVLQIDDETMPFTRWWIEERGFVDKKGNLTPEQLDRLTHGSQYYKPGYGHNWLRKLQDPSRIVRFLPIPLILLSLAIVVVPAAVTIIYAALTIQVCPDSPLTPH